MFPEGGFNWKISVPESGILPFDELFPAFIKWQSKENHPSKKLKPSNYFLNKLTISHPQGEEIKLLLRDLKDNRVSFNVSDHYSLSAELFNKSGKKVVLE